MIDEDGIQLNLTNTPQTVHRKRKKSFTSNSFDHVQGVEEENCLPRISKNTLVLKHEDTLSQQIGDQTVHVKKDRKIFSGRGGDRKKFISSLFQANPEIPAVDIKNLAQTSTDVFSTDSFNQLPELHPHLVSTLSDHLGLTHMTCVQRMTIPRVLQGHDCLVKSQTGSGKTLSYAIPIVNTLLKLEPRVKREDGAYAIILVPTRELAIQCAQELQKLTKACLWVVSGCIMGGERKKAEKSRIRKGLNIVVCTPGRLLDHIQNTTSLSLEHVRYLVLDEADRLLELGFERDLTSILQALDSRCSGKRQTLLLSATLTAGVERLATLSLHNSVFVDVSADPQSSGVVPPTSDEPQTSAQQPVDTYSLPANLRQHFIIVPSKLRLVTLSAFILWKTRFCEDERSKMMVFLSTQDSVDFHHQLLDSVVNDVDMLEHKKHSHIRFFKLHGNMSQKERTQIFFQFKEVRHGVLLCTDVASRGLDIPHIHWIVQYNCPGLPEEYIHRIGRTARLTNRGQALVFLTPEEVQGYTGLLQEQYHIQLHKLDMDTVLAKLRLQDTFHQQNKMVSNKTSQDCANELQKAFEEFVVDHRSCHLLAMKAFLSFVRSYAVFPKRLKKVFSMRFLHLGHVAKSFALRDPPTTISHVMRMKKRRAAKTHTTHRNTRTDSGGGSSGGGYGVSSGSGGSGGFSQAWDDEYSSGLTDFSSMEFVRGKRNQSGVMSEEVVVKRGKHMKHHKTNKLTEKDLARFD